MSYYVREPRGVPCTAEELQAAGRAVARAARESAASSVAEVVAAADLSPAAAEAVLARVEISAALGADRLGAEVLEHAAAFDPLPSHRIAGGNQRLAEAMAERLGDRVRLGVEVRSLRRARRGPRDPGRPAPRPQPVRAARLEARRARAGGDGPCRQAPRPARPARAHERGDERPRPLLVLDRGGQRRRSSTPSLVPRERSTASAVDDGPDTWLESVAHLRPDLELAGRRRPHHLARRRLQRRRPRRARRSPPPPAVSTSPASTPPARGPG